MNLKISKELIMTSNPILDPANWRIMKLWTEGVEREYPVYIGDMKLFERAMKELEAKNDRG